LVAFVKTKVPRPRMDTGSPLSAAVLIAAMMAETTLAADLRGKPVAAATRSTTSDCFISSVRARAE
jgi:hypothetical protein